jgi:hypothetical protein
MPGSRLPEEGKGAMARKVAEMLRSDDLVSAALTRASALARSRGLGPRVIERILASSPMAATDTLALLAQGTCGQPGQSHGDLSQAVAGPDLDGVWRAGLLACWAEFVGCTLARTTLSPRPVWATSWAVAETAHWAAGKHIVDPHEAFESGLALDLGLVALAYALPEVYGALGVTDVGRPLDEFESASFGFDHADVGRAALRLFRFSDRSVADAGSHTAPLLTLDMSGKVIRAACVAVSQAGGDFGLRTPRLQLDRTVLDGALLRAEHEPELLAVATKSLERALRFRSAASRAA